LSPLPTRAVINILHGLTAGVILTDNGREFCATQNHPFELYLALNDIEHRRTKVKSPKTNGFIERFNKTVLDEFFRITFQENFYETVEAGWLQGNGFNPCQSKRGPKPKERSAMRWREEVKARKPL
jgi:transposase InsO family protein